MVHCGLLLILNLFQIIPYLLAQLCWYNHYVHVIVISVGVGCGIVISAIGIIIDKCYHSVKFWRETFPEK